MGKKIRKTRWRTLPIADDDHSDSEESTTAHSQTKVYHHNNNNFNHHNNPKSYYNRFSTYSSQSTPIRRYNQYDGTKSTRSSSTASENKITFNEDEYTRITTPRQDVLFKKGYLNKPKTYQTQTSTGTSTTSTGNSTGNGTPDHQSTDLDYESQFVFPNGFVDQNGIYYVNSFEPYQLMVYNPPAYYQEVTDVKSKRYSTGSITESASPNNEESSSGQDENPPDFVYNVIYPGFYYNDHGNDDNNQGCQPDNRDDPNDSETGRDEPKRRRSRSSSSDAVSSSTDGASRDSPSPAEPVASSQAPETPEPATIATDLKPDAQEFVPRAYRHPMPETHDLQFVKLPPNFVPLPLINGEFGAFVPPAYPINFVPHGFVHDRRHDDPPLAPETTEICDQETAEVAKNGSIDIAKIVSKLEEAAKEQNDETRTEPSASEPSPPSQAAVARQPFKKRNTYVNNSNNNRRTNSFRRPNAKLPTSPHHNNHHSNAPQQRQRQDEEGYGRVATRNYSETLKTATVALGNHISQQRDSPRKGGQEPALPAQVEIKRAPSTPKRVAPPAQTTPDRWISVSNRKNKRKGINNCTNEDFDEPNFTEATPIQSAVPDDEFESYDVALLKDVVIATSQQPQEQENVNETVEVAVETPQIEEETVKIAEKTPEIDETKVVTEVANPKKKKSKNGKGNKAPIRRVIIKDVDLSISMMAAVKDEPKTPEVEPKMTEIAPKSLEVAPKTPEALPKSLEVPSKTPEVSLEVPEVPKSPEPDRTRDETNDKTKTKRKNRKSANKTTPKVSLATPLTEDSYDFLLETSPLLDDSSADRTNVEVSQELDRLIKRGMYSSLEEKMRLMNVDSGPIADEFFRDVIGDVATAPRPKAGVVATATVATLAPPTATCSHPITAAVKQWMTKARETTPEVEILKSPSAIYREFGDSSAEIAEEDEVTIFPCAENAKRPLAAESDGSTESGATSRPVDEVEVYESKYGADEDFAKIRREVEEAKGGRVPVANGNGDLPYRAICCSIM